MSEYPIEGLMNTAMNSIKEMVDVNTIIGEPIQTSNNIVIIPVSKVNFGFASGGSEFKGKTKKENKSKEENSEDNNKNNRMPFGGGSGAGVSISPIAFIVVQQSGVKLLPVEHTSALDKLLDLVPDLVDKVNYILDKQVKRIENKNETINKNYNNRNINNTTTTTNTTKNSKIIKNEVSPYDIEYDETSDM